MNEAKNPGNPTPGSVYLLMASLAVLGMGGIFGGGSLVIDPSGGFLKMPVTLLYSTPFPNYLIPGMILLIFLGFYPVLVFYAMLNRPDWKWADAFNIYPEQHWSCTHALYSGIILILWIDCQVMFIGYLFPMQMAYSFLGVFITVLAILPRLRKYYLKPGVSTPSQT